jgi:hypothetical protein
MFRGPVRAGAMTTLSRRIRNHTHRRTTKGTPIISYAFINLASSIFSTYKFTTQFPSPIHPYPMLLSSLSLFVQADNLGFSMWCLTIVFLYQFLHLTPSTLYCCIIYLVEIPLDLLTGYSPGAFESLLEHVLHAVTFVSILLPQDFVRLQWCIVLVFLLCSTWDNTTPGHLKCR